ncbi:ABC transporter permease [Paenibacillus mucilaginosus]|uniref:Binding-protein-dependent transport systems inner membrane component n=2 Tax=Paenibacillus mucilaginosus TaxID=61624 RepID=H6NEI9_9BACL|nr:ABC transporter permease subunit [Paenibacillus mucilaginosus]AEI42349.1 binding-protein-dependent transport systems inner membrane component [Paenibacillus mucilaginosus KNP414]AFC28132.1 binding-protein-dependent transport systems inner membrane component [Paenibacillus mucilaginosus 3016]MCG7214305.1 ABC transporter permease subunit [Paenibacillus mucilaginosus]WDM28812.1 sugar ABC transporter permease [Paenibacillus mucilaginosus]WFA16976.1 sugar ABC transporter permease [Paenibacillus 
MQSSLSMPTERSAKPSAWRSSSLYGYWKHRYLTLLLLPAIIYFIVFHYVPIYGIQIAFKQYRFMDGISGSPWVGLEHFRYLFSLDSFWLVLRNTLILSLLKFAAGFPAPILFAVLLNELRSLLFQRLVQTVTFFPHFISWVIMAGVLIQFLSPSIGPVNHLLKLLGFSPVFFVGDPDWFRWVLVFSDVWKDLGWGAIVYLAAIAGINPELYEVAKVDGAGRLQRMLHITLPGIAPVVTVMLILSVGKLIQDDFDQVFNLLNPAVYQVGDVLSTYTYRSGVEQLKYSFATAVGLFKNVISLLLVLGANWAANRFNRSGLW